MTRPQEGPERSTPLLVTRSLPLFPGTPKIAPALRFERPRHTLAKTIPSGNYPLNIATPRGMVRAPIIQEGRRITPLGTHTPALYQAVPLSGRDLRTSAASHKAFEDSKGPAPSDAPRPLTDGGTPFLRYHTPLNIAIDALRESIEGVEKKVAEGEHLIQKTAPDNLRLSDAGPDSTKKMNIDLTHLTDQLYRMLERKIKGERERRGLYG